MKRPSAKKADISPMLESNSLIIKIKFGKSSLKKDMFYSCTDVGIAVNLCTYYVGNLEEDFWMFLLLAPYQVILK